MSLCQKVVSATLPTAGTVFSLAHSTDQYRTYFELHTCKKIVETNTQNLPKATAFDPHTKKNVLKHLSEENRLSGSGTGTSQVTINDDHIYIC